MALIKIPKEMGSTPGIVDNSNATAITIDSSENVGIGRTSIAQPSSGATTLAIQGTDTTKGGAIRLYSSDDSVAAYIYPDNSSGLSINTSTSHPIVFRTVGTERMRIDASGRMGIGVTPEAWRSDWEVLRIGPKASFYSQPTATTGIAENIYYDTGNNWRAISTAAGSLYQLDSGNHHFYTMASVSAGAVSTPAEKFTIRGDGRVGINNTAPNYALCISDNSNPNRNGLEIAIGTSDTASNTIQNYNRATSAYTPLNIASSTLTFGVGTSATERMRVTSAGKLVVDGTVAGYSGCQITAGSPSITTSGVTVLSTTTGHGYYMFGDATGDAAAGYVGQIHYDHSSNSMDIVTNGVQACEWDSDGLQISNQILADGRRRGMYGIYSPTKLAHIWSMGTAYKVAADGSTGGNLYGLCYSYEPNYGSAGTNPGARSGLGHQMQWRANGGTHVAIGNGIYTVGSVTANSDARLKTDIETIPNAMSKVSALTGITYKRTDLSEPDSATGNQYDVRHTGVLAQELLAVLPEAVEGAVNGQQPEDGSYLSVAYGNMAGLFIEALKEQQATIEALTQRIETLENN